MLKVKTIYDYREEFAQALRASKLQQCVRTFTDDNIDTCDLAEPGYSVRTACAMGVGIRAGVFSPTHIYLDAEYQGSVRNRINLDPDEIADMNDAGKTFAEIADWVEAQP